MDQTLSETQGLALIENGYLVCDTLFQDQFASSLRDYALTLFERDQFRSAKTGQDVFEKHRPEIRSDQIFWIDDWNKNLLLNELNQTLESLKEEFNQLYYLSLRRFEGHFSVYEDGAFYKKHLDVHRNQRHRKITGILYLNDLEDQGELVLYKRENKQEVEKIIYPKTGRLVLFRSEQFYHEVKASYKKRSAVTFWFRDDMELF
ncbi:2OG-Fe(II) oxygenase [Halobacteriovorax sp. GB3]|uniref:2OG-Fe(II) oxygenase n=1 Tax=Halobacteriovorax sp. GB3 TaxID=2719615 RepID=UPI00235F1CAF|nr:2OG-Fe(II) oxygenase [Halobacteriovorax sp. GB3]MDD0854873.1 2OG-Fe(II) oxygenase [Halobacteriovorax sp. GB3]